MSGYYSVEPDNHPVEAFKDYYFGVNSRQFSEYTVPGNLEDAVTGANGELLISFNPSNFSVNPDEDKNHVAERES